MTIRKMQLEEDGKWNETYSSKTEDMYKCTEYVAIVNQEFCEKTECYVQLMLAVERKLPAFLFIKEGIDIPKDIQDLLDKVNVYYKEVVPTNAFPRNVKELRIFMQTRNSVILDYINEREKDERK